MSTSVPCSTATAVTFSLAPRPLAATVLLVALAVTLAVQVAVLRPRLEARAQLIIDGETPPRSRAHLAYIVLECAKLLMLAAFGIILMFT